MVDLLHAAQPKESAASTGEMAVQRATPSLAPKDTRVDMMSAKGRSTFPDSPLAPEGEGA
jgi:hypothetical protein